MTERTDDAEGKDEKTPQRKEIEQRAWEIIIDAPVPIDWKDGGFHMDFKHLASDIADALESAEDETRAYKDNYEEAMRLLGMQAYRTDPPADQPRNRKEYWWVRHKGMVVPAAVGFTDDKPKIVLFFGTEWTAKPDEVEMLTRLSQMSVPEGGWPAAKSAVRKVFDGFKRLGSKTVESDYGDGYHGACNHVLDAISEAADAGAVGDPRKLAEEKLDRFNRCAAGMMSERFAEGYREACTNIIEALAGEAGTDGTDQNKEG